jgi:hypothetical protein
MRAIVCNLMAALLLMHALVGCCRHHQHVAASHERVEAAESSATACCHHGHGCCGQEEKQAPAPCDCKLECKALCIYLPPEKCGVDAGDLSLSIDLAFNHHPEGGSAAIEAAAENSAWEYTRACVAPEPPVRLHLLHQIILV